MLSRMQMVLALVLLTGLVGCNSNHSNARTIDQTLSELRALTEDLDPVSKRALASGALTGESEPEDWARVIGDLIQSGNKTGDPGYYTAASIALHGYAASTSEPGAAASLTASVMQALHRFSDAEQAAREAVERRGLARDYGLLGDVLLERGRYDESAKAYQVMVDMKPDAMAYARAGNYRLAVGDLEGARELLGIARQGIGRSQPEAYSWIVSRLAWCELLGGSHISGLQQAQHASQIWPSRSNRLLLARAQLAAGMLEQSVDVLEKLVRDYPHSEALWLLSELYVLLGREQSAIETTLRLTRLTNPVDPRGHAAYLISTGGDLQAAAAIIREELAGRTDSHTLALHAFEVAQTGDLDAARDALARVLAPEPQAALIAAVAAQQMGLSGRAQELAAIANRGRLLLPPSQTTLLRSLLDSLKVNQAALRVSSY